MEKITSRSNGLLVHMKKLAASAAYRREQGVYLCDSPKLLAEALKWHAPVREIAVTVGVPLPPLPETVRAVEIPEDVMSSISPMKSPQGALFTVTLPETAVPEALPGSRYMVLDGVQDPGNVGTILRTADAAGFDGLLLSEQCADIFSPKVLRATMGSIFRMGVTVTPDLPGLLTHLREQGYSVISSQLDGTPFYQREGVAAQFVLVIGNEGNGVSPVVQATATHRLKLPMRGGAESLNAAVAAGIMMYELTREL